MATTLRCSASRIIPSVFLVILLAAPLAAAPAPPTLDAPLFDCARAVVVRGYDSGATLKVYVAGTLRGTKLGATSYSSWVDLTVALAGNHAVETTQTVGGVESARSAPVIVAAPDPPSLIHFMPPLVGVRDVVGSPSYRQTAAPSRSGTLR